MSNLLDVHNLSVRYGDAEPAVKNVSFTVAPGKIVGIIGESGSGKSTIAMAMLGLLPSSARVEADAFQVAGADVLGLSEIEFAKIRGKKASMIFQEPMSALNPSIRVGDQIAEVLLVHGLAAPKKAMERARELLELVHMPEVDLRLRQFPHQLSGGQRQRVMIAMAMAASSGLLVADEPTTALDVTVQAQILDLIVELRETAGLGVLIISHDLGVIGQVCDDVLVMYRGDVVEQGPTAAVLTAPQHAYTKALLDSVITGRQAPRTRLAVVQENFLPEEELVSVIEKPVLAAPIPAMETEPRSTAVGDTILQLESLVKTYKVGGSPIQALDDVSLAIRRGETFGIVGESGSGKSTLAQISMQLERPTSGRVIFDGEDVTRASRSRLRAFRSRIQVVFQDPNDSLDPRYRVLQSVAEPLRRERIGRDATRARVIASLESVGLGEDTLTRYPHEFSGGQRQRIAIARAMVTEPEFVVLDEATSALDVSIQAQILNLLLDIQKRTGVTYLFISHNLAVVRHMSHRMAVMTKGKVVESGDADEIFRNPQAPYTRRLLDSIPDLISA